MFTYEPDGPVIIMSPHFDDAALSCFSVLTHKDITPIVINAFTETPDYAPMTEWDYLTGADNAHERMKERIEEDRVVMQSLGVKTHNLDIFRPHYSGSDFVNRVQEMIGLDAPVSAVYIPAAIGGHPGHKDIRNTCFFALAKKQIPLFFYADIPYAIQYGWGASVKGNAVNKYCNPDGMYQEVLREVYFGKDIQTDQYVMQLNTADIQKKIEHIQLYVSQFETLNLGVGGRLTDPSIMQYEVFWPHIEQE